MCITFLECRTDLMLSHTVEIFKSVLHWRRFAVHTHVQGYESIRWYTIRGFSSKREKFFRLNDRTITPFLNSGDDVEFESFIIFFVYQVFMKI